MRAQVDARWTNEHHEEGGNHQQPDTPPTTTVEEDDPEDKQHSPEGNIGRDMSAGETLVVERSKDLDHAALGRGRPTTIFINTFSIPLTA